MEVTELMRLLGHKPKRLALVLHIVRHVRAVDGTAIGSREDQLGIGPGLAVLLSPFCLASFLQVQSLNTFTRKVHNSSTGLGLGLCHNPLLVNALEIVLHRDSAGGQVNAVAGKGPKLARATASDDSRDPQGVGSVLVRTGEKGV